MDHLVFRLVMHLYFENVNAKGENTLEFRLQFLDKVDKISFSMQVERDAFRLCESQTFLSNNNHSKWMHIHALNL